MAAEVDVQLRPADEGDTEFARQAHHAAYREVVERQFGAWDEAAQDAFFEKDWRGAVFDVIVVRGERAGYTAIEERDDDVHVRELVIVPAFQGRGVGSQVMREVMARAAARGVPVRLEALQLNRAIALYEKLGFARTGETETHLVFEWRPAGP